MFPLIRPLVNARQLMHAKVRLEFATTGQSRTMSGNRTQERGTHLETGDIAAPAQVLSAALYDRFSSRGHAGFANQLPAAMRHEFNGHAEKKS